MICKHKQIIRIINNTIAEYYCTAKQKEIKDYDCKGCMLYNPNTEEIINKLLGGFKNGKN